MSDVRKRIEQLVNVASPLWAGEAEVFRTYWSSPIRTRETDLLWLGRQCFKEFWGSGVGKYDRGGVVLGPVKNLLAKTAEIDITFKRDEIADLLEGVKAEFMHYSAFADAYDALRPAGSPSSTRTACRAGRKTTASPSSAMRTRRSTARSACAPASSPKAATARCSPRA